MKKRYPGILPTLVPIVFFIAGSAQAAIYCVNDAGELQSAMDLAASNSEDNTLQIAQGTYYGTYVYHSDQASRLSLEGGYSQGCTNRTIDAANTVLDGDGLSSVLHLESGVDADFSVDGLTVQNGASAEHGGGLVAITTGKVTLSNNVISNNASDHSGGGAYFFKAESTLTNNTFVGNGCNPSTALLESFWWAPQS